jgi:hypothetical protein
MAMPFVHPKQQPLPHVEAQVVEREKPARQAKQIDKQVYAVRVWGEEQDAVARAHLRALVDALGALEVAGLLGETSAAVAHAYTGGEMSLRLAEAAAAIPVPERAPEGPTTREQRRSRRKGPRARTISVKRMTKRELELGRLLFPEQPGVDYERPKTRGDCARLRGTDERGNLLPCGFVSCRHHLLLDVSPDTGAIKINHVLGLDDIFTMKDTCSLDVAERGPHTLEQVGEQMSWTRERQRQVELLTMAKIQAMSDTFALRDFVDEGPVGKRRLPVLRVVRDEPEADEPDTDEDDFDTSDLEAP